VGRLQWASHRTKNAFHFRGEGKVKGKAKERKRREEARENRKGQKLFSPRQKQTSKRQARKQTATK
jgi:hypothetical protein